MTTTERSGDARPPADVLEPEPWDRKLDRKAAMMLFAVVWAVYLATASYTVHQMNDTRSTTQSAWSLGTRGTVALPEEWRGSIDWEVEGVDGRLYTDRFPGATLWAAPFHTVGDLLFPRPTPGHPWLLNYAPSGVAAATAAALGVVVSFLLFRRLADRRLAIGAALALAFATGTWSISGAAMWNHGLTHLTLSLGVLAAVDGRHLRSGAAFAGAIITRPQVAVVAAVVGLWRAAVKRSLLPAVWIGLVAALGVAALAVYTRSLFGSWLPVAGYSESKVSNVVTVPVLEFFERVGLTLVDPARGLFVYVPVLLVLLPFVRHGWKVSPWWPKAAAIAGLVYLAVQLRSNVHHGGGQFFGSRLTLETLVLATPLLLRTWQAYVSRRRVLRSLVLALLGVGVVLHGLGATVWQSPFFDDQTVWAERMAEVCADPETVGCPDGDEPG